MKRFTLLAALLTLACAPAEDRSGMRRNRVTPAAVSGWARLPLAGTAQQAQATLWLGDAQGVSIPFELEREGLWQPLPLDPERLLLGSDAQGRPTAEFSLKLPPGRQIRDREHLKVALDLEATAPWSCRVEVERRLEGGAYLRLERPAPLHVFDLGESGKRTFVYLPWDAQDYRLTLVPAQGAPPRLKGATLTASTRPEERQPDEALSPSLEPAEAKPAAGGAAPARTWTLRLPGPERVVGAELLLQPPVAPVKPLFRVPGPDAGDLAVQGAVWNLPALADSATRVDLAPVVTDRLELSLPAGVGLAAVKLLVRRDVLLFPAEAGQTYYLHTGGRAKAAPGSLGALPPSSRAIYTQPPLRLGDPEPDPQGLPRLIDGAERTRPWLPWVTGLAVAILGGLAWRLLKRP